LRAVSLLGIDSVMCPQPVRRQAWKRLATDLDRGKLHDMVSEIGLPDVVEAGQAIVEGKVRGRTVVKVG
jgi:acrylyl-CoA reductase (NADPH)